MMMVTKHRTIVFATITALAVLSMFAWLFVWNKQTTAIVQPEVTTATQPIGSGQLPNSTAIPSSILQQLELRFQEIQPTMGEADVLETLRLDTCSKYLANHHSFQMGGGGYNHKIYVLNPDGHVLEFRDFMGNFPACILHLPGNRNVKTAEIGELVSDMAGFFEYMNPRDPL